MANRQKAGKRGCGRMMVRGLLASGLLAEAVTAVLPGMASAEPLQMKFHVHVLGLQAMRVKFSGDLRRDGYAGAAELKPRGAAGSFVEHIRLRVKGRFNHRHPLPFRFYIHSRKKGKVKEASITWTAEGRLADWKRKPPLDAARKTQVLAAIARGAIDPLSLMVAIGVSRKKDPCSGKARVFNGLKVFDIHGTVMGRERLRNLAHLGETLKCRLVYVPVAGMSERKKRKRLQDPPVFEVWLARTGSTELGALWLPVKARGRLKGWPFAATLAEATLAGRPLAPAR